MDSIDFHAQFPESVGSRSLSINAFKFLTVIVAAKVCGKLWCGLWFLIQYGNETSVTMLNTCKTHNSFLQGCLRKLELLAARCEFEIQVVQIKGVDNHISDVLSRCELGREHGQCFSELTAGMMMTEKLVYEGMCEFVHDW